MARSKKQKQKPFHELILIAIRTLSSEASLKAWARFIVVTKVPAGRSEIINALRQKAITFNAGSMPELKMAISSLMAQEAEEAEETRRNPQNLLFPGPFMERGSTGPAVGVLQLILKVLGCNEAIEIDLDFGDETEEGLKVLQRRYGLEADGKCGPGTRERIHEEIGIKLNALSADLFKEETVTVPPDSWA